MNKLQYILPCFLLICTLDSFSQSDYNLVTTAVPFLRISTDAKASGMGSTGIATSPDINAVYWNLGKLAFADTKASINANYSPWLKEWSNDMYITSLAGYFKFNDDEAIHGMVKYFSPGDLQFTDNNGNHLRSYHPNEFEVQIGYSRKLSRHFSTGLGIKYIRSDLAKGTQEGESFKPSNAVAFDLGFYYDLKKEKGDGWSFGAALSNLGSKVSYTNSSDDKAFIPANLGMGASYTRSFDEQNKLVLGLDVNKLLVPRAPADSASLISYRDKTVVGSWFSSFSDASFKNEIKEFQVSIGAEYWYNNQFALRAGYFYEDKTNGGRKHFSTGASVKYNILTANFSYLIPSSGAGRNPLSNTLLFGIVIELGK
jgi:hypothetical protein